jgi:hypothetical protein
MKSELNTKNIDELLSDERAYADSLREATKPAEQLAETGAVHEAGKASSTNDEFDAIVTRIAKK